MRTSPDCDLYIDGASRGNPGPAGAGGCLQDAQGVTVRQFSKYLGETTNNVAEYLALIYGLHEALREGCSRLTVKTDSELLARQISGQYRVREPHLRLLYDLAVYLKEGFASCRVIHIPREQNKAADRLAGEAVKGKLAH